MRFNYRWDTFLNGPLEWNWGGQKRTNFPLNIDPGDNEYGCKWIYYIFLSLMVNKNLYFSAANSAVLIRLNHVHNAPDSLSRCK